MGFAQGGRRSIFSLVYPSARKGDLAGMGSKIVAALGQDQAGLGPVRDRDKNCSLPRFSIMTFQKVARQQVVRRVIGQRQGDSLDQTHETIGKNILSDQMPGGS